MSGRTVNVVAAASAALWTFCATWLSAEGPASTQWSQWRGPRRDGTFTDAAVSTDWSREGPRVLWRAEVGAGCSSAVVRDGRVWVLGSSGSVELDKQNASRDVVTCLDAATGAVLWKFEYDEALNVLSDAGGPNATPACDGKRLFTMSKMGRLHCLDAADGKVLWHRPLVEDDKQLKKIRIWGGIASSPLVIGEIVIVSTGTVLGIDRATGKTLYEIPASNRWVSPKPVQLDGRTTVCMPQRKDLLFFEPADGTEVRRIRGVEMYACDPVFFDGKVFVSVRGGKSPGSRVYALDDADNPAKALWQNTDDGSYWGNAVAIGDAVCIGQERSFACVDAATGVVRWTDRKLPHAQPVLADGKIVLVGADGILRVIEPGPEEKIVAQARVLAPSRNFSLSVAVTPGRILCKSCRGELVCVDVRTTDTAR